jgi:hypothetical protein
MNITEKIINNYKVIEYKNSNIFIIKNLLNNSFCDDVIKIIDILPLQKAEICYGNNVECDFFNLDNINNINDEFYYKFSTDEKIFNNLLENLKNNKNILSNSLNGVTKEELFKLKNNIHKNILTVESIINKINKNINFNYNSGYILRKITGKTRLHKDGINKFHESQEISFLSNNKINGNFKAIRNATMIFSLNNNYDGGIFNFPYYEISIKLDKGDVIIFPPYWTHEHEVTNLENNTIRYTISTWLCEELM